MLHWHLVDAQAFPVRSDLYPELAEKGACDPLATHSKADLREMVAYAKSRGVRVMPEFDVPGRFFSRTFRRGGARGAPEPN